MMILFYFIYLHLLFVIFPQQTNKQVLIGETKVIRFGGCASGAACTIVLRGSSTHILQEAERSLHDALCILVATIQNPRRIYGGGCTEVRMARAIDGAAIQTPGKQALAMQAFSKALLQLPMIIADNGGFDAAELVTQLRAAHANPAESNQTCSFGLDMETGKVGSMQELGIMESYTSKLQVVSSAAEAAEMILRVDDIIKCAPRRREEQF
jgi:T-complex protein 1 subunit beta